MAFGRKNEDAPETASPDYVTRGEAQSALGAYVTKEDAESVRTAVATLGQRVTALENLANDLRARQSGDATPEQPSRVEFGSTTLRSDLPTRTPGAALGVDYGAIAFGLSEIKRTIVNQFNVSNAQLRDQYTGTVQYFADVFAKSDPSFDEALFKRQSGV
jgi:hypothetical protein